MATIDINVDINNTTLATNDNNINIHYVKRLIDAKNYDLLTRNWEKIERHVKNNGTMNDPFGQYDPLTIAVHKGNVPLVRYFAIRYERCFSKLYLSLCGIRLMGALIISCYLLDKSNDDVKILQYRYIKQILVRMVSNKSNDHIRILVNTGFNYAVELNYIDGVRTFLYWTNSEDPIKRCLLFTGFQRIDVSERYFFSKLVKNTKYIPLLLYLIKFGNKLTLNHLDMANSTEMCCIINIALRAQINDNIDVETEYKNYLRVNAEPTPNDEPEPNVEPTPNTEPTPNAEPEPEHNVEATPNAEPEPNAEPDAEYISINTPPEDFVNLSIVLRVKDPKDVKLPTIVDDDFVSLNTPSDDFVNIRLGIRTADPEPEPETKPEPEPKTEPEPNDEWITV
jgi:hypothetical protein